MRKTIAFIGLSALLLGNPVHAGPGHDHGHSHDPMTIDAAKSKAAHKVLELVQRGKIDKSWAEIKPSSAEQKVFSKGPEWVVTFTNAAVSDPGKQTLYIFYSLDGHYLAANYTGN